jgi:hypothetical protein
MKKRTNPRSFEPALTVYVRPFRYVASKMGPMLRPDETQLDGSVVVENGRPIKDAIWERIRELTENVLTRICTDWSRWSTLYRDPQDGRFWELIYPQSATHGGGAPSLRLVEKSDVDVKYGVNAEDPFGPRRTMGSPLDRDLPREVIAGVRKIFAPTLFDTAQELLKRTVVRLYLDARPRECVRVLLAAIRYSNGNIARMEAALQIARGDWRDLLVSAGLADDDREKILQAEGFEIPPA